MARIRPPPARSLLRISHSGAHSIEGPKIGIQPARSYCARGRGFLDLATPLHKRDADAPIQVYSIGGFAQPARKFSTSLVNSAGCSISGK
jgi:hypothetical protein